jgi:DNA-binding GntR family transcriptional regulator
MVKPNDQKARRDMSQARRKRTVVVRASVAVRAESDGSTRQLSEIAYGAILQGLFERKIPCGAFLTQNDLVKLLGVPIQPLRDALRVLESEGVVFIQPRSGIQFLKPDMELARSTYQFRSIIERAAVRHFAETSSLELMESLMLEHAALLESINNDGLDAKRSGHLEALDQRLHAAFITSLSNPLIETTAARLKNYVTLIRMDRLRTAPLAIRTLREHMEILDACRRRDAQSAEAALANHFNAALYRVLGL